jgi:uncharacterized membrane protein
LADAVFAFTITLLVVALEVPKDYNALLEIFQGFPAFVTTFAILLWFWNMHYTFFRRYGLEDAWTRFLNAAILLFVVFLAYPLKFIFNSAFASMLGWGNNPTGIETITDLSRLYIIYGGGLASVSLGYLLLYFHAYRQRDALRLSLAEAILTRGSLFRIMVNIAICLLSILLAMMERFVWQPGMVYALLGPGIGFTAWHHGKRATAAFRANQKRSD